MIGRAGMQYRDLIPGRLGGSIIASHIRVPDAGPVPDMVHYHTIGFQLIFCYRGWVRLVYEDQGPPFVLAAGDCVIQPPEIRHRVLESSGNLQVIEIGVPAAHLTTIDHEMELPTPTIRSDRLFGGQRFCRSEAASAVWQAWRVPGFVARDTGIAEATGGVASVGVVRPQGRIERVETTHASDILFTFVLAGRVTLEGEGQGRHVLEEGDAYVVPPGLPSALSAGPGAAGGVAAGDRTSSAPASRAVTTTVTATRLSPCTARHSSTRARRLRAACPLPRAGCRCAWRRARH